MIRTTLVAVLLTTSTLGLAQLTQRSSLSEENLFSDSRGEGCRGDSSVQNYQNFSLRQPLMIVTSVEEVETGTDKKAEVNGARNVASARLNGLHKEVRTERRGIRENRLGNSSPLTTYNVNQNVNVVTENLRNEQDFKTRQNNEPKGYSSRIRGVVPCLYRDKGCLDFIRVIKSGELDSIRIPSDGLLVVVPRENFLITEEDSELSAPIHNERKNGKTFDSSSITSPIRTNKPDSYKEQDYLHLGDTSKIMQGKTNNDCVVFILTNLPADELSLLLDAKNGRWDFTDLLNAALIAEGLTTKKNRAHYRARFETLLASLKVQTTDMTDPLMKTQCVYDFLHSQTLVSKYDLNCSSIAASLDLGVFNCVSATVLFNCLAKRVGLEVAALETTGHAKSRVKFTDSYLDVETTCSSWSRLPDHIRPYQRTQSEHKREEILHKNHVVVGERTEGLDGQNNVNLVSSEKLCEDEEDGVQSRGGRVSTGQVSFKSVIFDSSQNGFMKETSLKNDSANSDSINSGRGEHLRLEDGSTMFTVDRDAPLGYSFTRTRRPMREITDVELIATIYYNVGVDHYQAGDYEGAVASYVKAAQLAPNNRTILGNLKATLNNWAIDVATKEKKYDEAIRITELGLAIDPNFQEFNMNMPIFFHDWIEYLARDNKWDEIKYVQKEYWKRFPKEKSEKN